MDFSQEKYKLSRYNVFHNDGEAMYIWNTYSDALLKLDESGQSYIDGFLGVDDESNEFNILKANGFIVDENLNEFNRVCMQEKHALFTREPSHISFVIAPGMGCNYSCKYCFESNSDLTGVMTSELANEVSEYICKKLEGNSNVKKVRIKWFGGEPLLYLKAIKIISQNVIEYAEQNNIEYSSNITTNGRYLDEDALSLLQELKIKNAQITVDGTCDVYCESKGATVDDFNNVIDNICRSAEKMKVVVRLNIPDNDVAEAIKITDYLFTERGLFGKANIHFAHLCDYSHDKDSADKSFINFTDNYYRWIEHMIKHYDISSVNLFAERLTTSCGLVKACNECIGPHGELYKCEHNFGTDSMIIGNIWQGRFYNETEKSYTLTIDNPINSNCFKCEYVPNCMGGCANDRINNFKRYNCESFKRFQYRQKLLKGGVCV